MKGYSMMIEFTKFPKIPRLNRDMIITEKIDGTNASVTNMVLSNPSDNMRADFAEKGWGIFDFEYNSIAVVPASRNRYITLKKDNYGFAKWVHEHAEELLSLGIGQNFGEWWGKGIQRGYDQMKKHFSLFNVTRWEEEAPLCCDVVPVLYEGPFETYVIEQLVDNLWEYGSKAAPGFMDPEGVVVFHKAANRMFKVTCKNDEMPKGQMTG